VEMGRQAWAVCGRVPPSSGVSAELLAMVTGSITVAAGLMPFPVARREPCTLDHLVPPPMSDTAWAWPAIGRSKTGAPSCPSRARPCGAPRSTTLLQEKLGGHLRSVDNYRSASPSSGSSTHKPLQHLVLRIVERMQAQPLARRQDLATLSAVGS
jgi:hypothetical protein